MANRFSFHRRAFLKSAAIVGAGATLGGWLPGAAMAGELPFQGAGHAERLGWLLGSQAYTFRKFSFFEAVDKIASLGLGYVEAYPKQVLDKKNPGVHMGDGLDKTQRQQIKDRLDKAGVKMVNYGVCKLTNDEPAARRTFEFAKAMGVRTVVAEPPADAFDLVEKLCDEYEINLAIHNHPKPSYYWDYRTVLKACQGRSKRMGACCDTGHWMRSGIEPLEALRALEGRIISLHLKDLNEFGQRRAHDVPWGSGKGDVRKWLLELNRQKFQGVFSIEYEKHSDHLMQDVAHCVGYFDGVSADLAASR